MDKKTIDTLRVMLCGEIEDIAKKGNLGTHENLDILKDLIETEKNLGKIEEQEREKEQAEEMKKNGMSMDGGYSQRKYFIDADYQPGMYAQGGGNSYIQGGRAMYDMNNGNSYGGSRVMYDMGGNSYMQGGMNYGMGNSNVYYDPRYETSRARGYAQTGSKEEIVAELHRVMSESNSDAVKKAVSEAISKVEGQ